MNSCSFGFIGASNLISFGSGLCIFGAACWFLSRSQRRSHAARLRDSEDRNPDEPRLERSLRLNGAVRSVGIMIAGAIIILAGLFKLR